MAHYRPLLAAVISFLEDEPVVIIEVEFSLKRELLIRVEDVKREYRLRTVERRGVPAYAHQLAVVFNPLRTFRASAKLDIDVVNPVVVDHNDGSSLGA